MEKLIFENENGVKVILNLKDVESIRVRGLLYVLTFIDGSEAKFKYHGKEISFE